jgi:hypothetical protein
MIGPELATAATKGTDGARASLHCWWLERARSIDQHDTGHSVRMVARKGLNILPADGVAHQEIGARETASAESSEKLFRPAAVEAAEEQGVGASVERS